MQFFKLLFSRKIVSVRIEYYQIITVSYPLRHAERLFFLVFS